MGFPSVVVAAVDEATAVGAVVDGAAQPDRTESASVIKRNMDMLL